MSKVSPPPATNAALFLVALFILSSVGAPQVVVGSPGGSAVDDVAEKGVVDGTESLELRGQVENGTVPVRVTILHYMHRDPDEVGVDAQVVESYARSAAEGGSKLVVLPEISLYDYNMGEEKAKVMAQQFDSIVADMGSLADELNICMVFGLWEPSGDPERPVYNTAVFLGPDGRMLGKHRKIDICFGYLKPGDDKLGDARPFNTPLGRVGMLICYDMAPHGGLANPDKVCRQDTIVDRKVDLFITIQYVPGCYSPTIVCTQAGVYGLCCNSRWSNMARSQVLDPTGNIIAETSGAGINQEMLNAIVYVPKKRYALFETNWGPMLFDLHDSKNPNATRNFTEYVRDGFYDGLTFHHVQKDSMARTGLYDTDLSLKTSTYPTLPLENYFDWWGAGGNESHTPGTLSLYHPDGDPNGATTELMITDGAHPERDNQYSIFGRLIKGAGTFGAIMGSSVSSTQAGDGSILSFYPDTPITITDVSIINDIPDFPPQYLGGLESVDVQEDTTWSVDLSTVFTDDEGPTNLTVTCNRGEIDVTDWIASWSPVCGDLSLLGVVFTATNGDGKAGQSPPIDLIYVDVNDPPECTGYLADVTIAEEGNWTVDLSAQFSDEESQGSLVYSCSHVEVGIDGTFAWWHPTTGPRVLTDVVFTATDPQNVNLSVSMTPITLTCTAVNDAPRFVGTLESEDVLEETAWNLDLVSLFSDEEEDVLTFTCSSPDISMDGSAASWIPDDGDRDQVDVTFTASDPDGLSAMSPPITLTIVPVNDPPKLGDTDVITVKEDEPYDLDLTDLVSDPDSALADLDVTTDSDHVEVDGLVLTFLYPDGVTGEDVEVVVSDGEFDVSTTLEVTVDGSNDPPEKPVVDGISDGWIYTDLDTFDIRVTAEDGDGDPVGVTITSSIDGDLGDGQGVTLSPGEHTITVTATDSNGEVSTTVLSVKVVAAGSDDPDAGKDTGGDDITDGDGSGSGDDGAGADGTGAEGTGDGTGGEDGSSGDGSGSGWLLPAVLVAVAVVVAILLGAMYFMKGRGPGGGEPDGAPSASPPRQEAVENLPDSTANQANNKHPRM